MGKVWVRYGQAMFEIWVSYGKYMKSCRLGLVDMRVRNQYWVLYGIVMVDILVR